MPERPGKATMVISFTFCLNAAFNFVLGFVLAAVLGPAEFGRFAIGSTVAIVISTAFFDWLRLTAVRRYNEKSRESDPALRATLNATYLGGAMIIVGGALLIQAIGVDIGLRPAMIAAIAAASIATAQFEYWMALARARFRNGTYATLVITKNVLAFGLMVGTARLYHDAALVLAAVVPSIALAAIPAWRVLRDTGAHLTRWRRDRVVDFARYGVPIVAGNIIFQLIVLINRWSASTHFGYAEAGQLAFSTDLCIRLLVAVGAAFDVLLFQVAVRKEALHGNVAARDQMAQNMSTIAAALVPLAAGFMATLPAFTALFVPAQYRAEFAMISLILVPGMLAYALTQFVIGPVFQLGGRTAPMVYAALAALTTDLALLSFIPLGHASTSIAFLHSVSLLVALTVAAMMAWRTRAPWPPLRDFLGVALATGFMVLAVWPTRSIGQPWIALVSAVSLGVTVYAVLLVAFDVAGLRSRIGSKFPSSFAGRRMNYGTAIRNLKAH